MEKLQNKKTIIYFDNAIFNLQKIGGISIVFSALIKKLKQSDAVEINMVVNNKKDADDSQKNITYEGLSEGINTVSEMRLPKILQRFAPLLKKLPAGVIYHSTYNRYSFQKNILKVITVHDLGHEKKIMQQGIKRLVHVFFKRIAIAAADGIICVSESTKKDLMLYYGNVVKNKFIKVIYNGLSEDFVSYDVGNVQVKGSNAILFVGSRYGYKNFDKAVRAVSETRDFEMIVAGGGALSQEDKNLLDESLPGRYSVEVDISTPQLRNLYSNSFCLLYPSSYEGFGLPILEAMASGCPVVCCDNSCIREVAGSAALIVAKPGVEDLLSAINLLGHDQTRRKMISEGKIHSANFSWDNTVTNTIKFYKELIQQKSWVERN